MMEEGGILVDYHGCDFFPERWFDLVVVLQTDNSILHDRLTGRYYKLNFDSSAFQSPRPHICELWLNLIRRGYTGSKLKNNIECEIFQVLLEEARESYREDIVMPLRSDNVDDISRNVGALTDWISNWRPSWPVKLCYRISLLGHYWLPPKRNVVLCFVYWSGFEWTRCHFSDVRVVLVKETK